MQINAIIVADSELESEFVDFCCYRYLYVQGGFNGIYIQSIGTTSVGL